MKKSLSSLILFFATFFISCRSESIDLSDQSKHILALVGDKTITVNDFIKRCEYVPRPPYCNGDSAPLMARPGLQPSILVGAPSGLIVRLSRRSGNARLTRTRLSVFGIREL